ncbi:hypothetical protein CEUSTIGMA_g11284.t1 [Chlamydomonas eustigma]|uniref:Uncharacterized protein n=1 Tax=Chlamydomonas eustigma TaxID=1157962 RepID=A0A250XLQ2_9CHLO|nr:hypothetical protein CEUSTIGMA_g11284.t1 [Chlamydomonas eustigma]|eukprot:GAX83859.1 hypothetical protein CEUSTIGMA_g11284.t1 [Chlamydomonas eustigma]
MWCKSLKSRKLTGQKNSGSQKLLRLPAVSKQFCSTDLTLDSAECKSKLSETSEHRCSQHDGGPNTKSRRSVMALMPGLLMLPLSSSVCRSSQAIPLGPLGAVKRVGGKLTREIFDDQCRFVDLINDATGLSRYTIHTFYRFVDPTNDVTGLNRYITALSILFDPQLSKVILKEIKVTGPRKIEVDYVSGGYLQEKYFPWRPRVKPYEGHVVYTLNSEGLIKVQSQTWNISPAEALIETFTPTWGERAPVL